MKAELLCSYVSSFLLGGESQALTSEHCPLTVQLRAGPVTTVTIRAFYDGPEPPTPSPFANFSGATTVTPGGWRTRSFTSLVQSTPTELFGGQRILYHSASVRYATPSIVKAIPAIGDKYSAPALLRTGVAINIYICGPAIPLSTGLPDADHVH